MSAEYLQWFRQVDRDNSGYLDVFELQRALGLGNINFSQKTVRALMRLYDPANSGQINMRQYESMHVFLSNVTQAFRRFDSNGDGTLSREEVKQALACANYRLEAPAFNKLFESFDPDSSNSFNLTEFLGMTIFLQSLSSTFGAFDQAKTGRITLTFDQAVYFCSSVL